MERRHRAGGSVLWISLTLLAIFWALPAAAQKMKDPKDALDRLAFVKPEMRPQPQIELDHGMVRSLASPALLGTFDRLLTETGVDWQVTYDRATDLPNSMGGQGIPWIPGTGDGNRLTGADLSLPSEFQGADIPVASVEKLARDFMARYGALFGANPKDLRLASEGSGPMLDYLYYLNFDWNYLGIPVEHARVVFTVNHGNLIDVGQEFIGPGINKLDPVPSFTPETAWQILWGYLGQDGPGAGDTAYQPGRLLVVPAASPGLLSGLPAAPGSGLEFRLVWVLAFHREGVVGNWEARVDAHSGEILSFQDENAYGVIRGGTYKGDKPFSEQNVPFPYADYGGSSWSDVGGNFPGSSGTSTMTGRTGSAGNVGSVDIVDSCGSISMAASGGNIDFLMSAGLDCTTPGSGGAGNTHASRTQYWNIAQIKIKAYTYLAGNSWLQGRLTDNVNGTATTCNAYWNGTSVNFFQSGAGCWNTGELPGVSLHEFAHGLDANDGVAASNGGSGETYGDITALLQTHSSCMGNGFMGTNTNGYGDAALNCTGVRELDYAKHAGNTPYKGSMLNATTGYRCTTDTCAGPCGYECHCESLISSQAVWDLASRDLITWGMDQATAWQLVDRLWYASRPSATSVYYCPSITTTSGCATGTIWRTFCAVDDDNGNLADGTPHSTAISTALNRHAIACTTDAYYNKNFSACAPLASTVVTATPATGAVYVNWNSVTSATNYYVYRNETGCDQGYTKVATVASPTTTYTDTMVANGIAYNYRVQAQAGASSICVGAMSACATATPLTCTLLAAPTGLAATANGSYRIDVSWNSVVGAVSFNLYRSTTSGGPWTFLNSTSGSTTSYSDTSVYGGTTYYYMVRTFATCESLNSTQASALAGGTCNRLPTFGGLTSAANALNAACRVILTWGAGSSACSGTISYNIYRSRFPDFMPGPENRIASGVSGTTYTDQGGSFKQRYYYIVRAVDSVSALEDGNFLMQTAYPTGAKSTITSNTFEANWTGWTNGFLQTPVILSAPTVTWNWERGIPGATTNNYGGAGNPGYDHTTGTGYCLVTGAAAGAGAGSNDVDYGEVWVQSPSFSAGTFPSVEVNLWRWFLNDHTDTAAGCTYPDGYELDVSNNGSTYVALETLDETCSTQKGCGTNQWINVKFNLEDYTTLSTTMYIKMRAMDGQNGSPYSSGSCAGDLVEAALDDFYIYGYANCTACSAPAVPTLSSVTPNGANRIDLAWTGNGTTYSVFRSLGPCPGTTWVQVGGNIAGTTFSDTSVSAGNTYAYVVRAYSATYCESAASSCLNATALAGGSCSLGPIFTGVATVANSHTATCGITVTWAAATVRCGSTPVYNIYRSTSSSFAPGDTTRIAKGATGTSYSDVSGLVYGTTYYYIVRAEDNTTGGPGPNGGNEETNTVIESSGPSGGLLTANNIFFDDFETGSGTRGWDKGSFYATDTTMTDVRGVQTCSPTQSGTKIWRWGGSTCTATNYANSRASFASPLPNAYGIDIPFDATNVKLSFYHRYNFQAAYDGAMLLLQKAPTATYYFIPTALVTGHAYNNTTAATGNPIGASIPCWAGNFNTQMYLTTVDLDAACIAIDGKPCAGSSIAIAFTGSSNASTTAVGWYIDDVKVYGDYGTTTCTTSGCEMLVEVTPVTSTALVNQDVMLTAKHTGTAPPYSYQWTEGGSDIIGATQSTFTARKGSAGTYTYNCKVTDSSGRCANVTDTAPASVTWTSGASLPKRVAYSVTPTTGTKTDAAATNMTVGWDSASCASAGFHLVYGLGSSISTLDTASPTTAGGVCSIGIGGSYSWSGVPDPSGDSSRFLWFLVVGNDGGTTEGSWGLTYPAGLEEGRGTPSGRCSCTAKDTTSVCGTP